MAGLPHAAPRADADGGAGVAADGHGPCRSSTAQIRDLLEEALGHDTPGRTVDDAVKLGLRTGEGTDLVSHDPGLDQMRAHELATCVGRVPVWLLGPVAVDRDPRATCLRLVLEDERQERAACE
eukprot:8639214-Pyramimonas_sp.AAC.1